MEKISTAFNGRRRRSRRSMRTYVTTQKFFKFNILFVHHTRTNMDEHEILVYSTLQSIVPFKVHNFFFHFQRYKQRKWEKSVTVHYLTCNRYRVNKTYLLHECHKLPRSCQNAIFVVENASSVVTEVKLFWWRFLRIFFLFDEKNQGHSIQIPSKW